MQNIPDNQLDNFFKDALENPRAAFNPKAWSSMEKKLERALIRKLWVSRLKYLSLIFLTVSVLTVVWNKTGDANVQARAAKNNYSDGKPTNTIDFKNEGKHLIAQSSHSKNDKSILAPSPAKLSNVQSKKKNIISESLIEDVPVKSNNSESALTQSSLKSLNLTKEDKNQRNNNVNQEAHIASNSRETNSINTWLNFTNKKKTSNISSQHNNTNEKYFEDFKPNNQGKYSNKKLVPPIDQEINLHSFNKQNGESGKTPSTLILSSEIDQENIKAKGNSNQILTNSFQEHNLQPFGAFHSINSLIPVQLNFNQKSDEDGVVPKDVKKKENSGLRSPLIRIGGQISPDFSSYVDAAKWRSGYNTGFSVEFFPFKRLSLLGGVLTSKKVYSADPNQYEPYPGFWGNKTLPKNIEGICNITDLQLNLRYYVIYTPKIKVFAGTGISSYLMRHEVYTYDYTTWQKTIMISKKNNHYFSIINLSGGIEHKLGNRFSVGIEPFIKIPVTGIGAGKIKLKSGGAFVSLTYLLLSK